MKRRGTFVYSTAVLSLTVLQYFAYSTAVLPTEYRRAYLERRLRYMRFRRIGASVMLLFPNDLMDMYRFFPYCGDF